VSDTAAPRKLSGRAVILTVAALVAAVVLSIAWFFGSAAVAPDVTGVTEVSIGTGNLTVVQDGTDRLEIKPGPGMAARVMARRTGTLLELGEFDDADPRVLVYWLLPKPDASAGLEFILHTTSATRFAANDHGNVSIDGFTADELKISAMSVATVVAKNIDVGVLDVSFDGDASGSVVVAGTAKSRKLFQSGAPAAYDESGLTLTGP